MDKQAQPEDVRKVLSTWARIRLQLREPFAEFLGTCLVRTRYSSQNTLLKVFKMVVSLQGVVAQVSLADLQFGTYFSISVVTGIAVMLGVLIAGPVSGGHLNPSVTLAFVVFRRLSLKKAALYFLGQVRRCLSASKANY
jgi:aquaglyceroporin related protein